MQIQITVTDDDIQNLFDSVLGGAYSGWIKTFAADQDKKGNWRGKVQFDREQDQEGTFKGRFAITNDTVKAGLEAMAREFPSRFGNLLAGDIDAVDADVFMQSLVFGREVYA